MTQQPANSDSDKGSDGQSQDDTMRVLRESSRVVQREASRVVQREPSRVVPRETPAGALESTMQVLRESSRVVQREPSRQVLREPSKQVVREASKQVLREPSKQVVREASKQVVREASKGGSNRATKGKPPRLVHAMLIPWRRIGIGAAIAVLCLIIASMWNDANAPVDPFENIDSAVAVQIIDAIITAQTQFNAGPVSPDYIESRGWTPGRYAPTIDDLIRSGVLQAIPLDGSAMIEKKVIEERFVEMEATPGVEKRIVNEKNTSKRATTIDPQALFQASTDLTRAAREPVAGYYFKILNRFIGPSGGVIDLAYSESALNGATDSRLLKNGYAILAYPKEYRDPKTTPVIIKLVLSGPETGALTGEYDGTIPFMPAPDSAAPSTGDTTSGAFQTAYSAAAMHSYTAAPWLGEAMPEGSDDALMRKPTAPTRGPIREVKTEKKPSDKALGIIDVGERKSNAPTIPASDPATRLEKELPPLVD